VACAAGVVACTGPNPAFKGKVRLGDAGDLSDLGGGGGSDNRGGSPGGGTGGAGGLAGQGMPDAFVPGTGGSESTTDTGLDSTQAAPDAPVPMETGPSPDTATPADTAPADLGPPADPRPTMSLAAHWAFDDAAASTLITDSSGNTAKLTSVTRTMDSSPGVTGGSSLNFDGSKSYIDVTMKTALRSQDPKTIALWFRNRSTSGLTDIVTMYNSKEVLNFGAQVGFSGNRLAFWRFGQNNAELTSAAVDDNWHHAAYTFEGSTHTLYLDGKPAAPALNGAVVSGTLDTVRIGTYDAKIEMFAGQINDLRIYTRALTPAEVAAVAKPIR
jgi:hypothetical protein